MSIKGDRSRVTDHKAYDATMDRIKTRKKVMILTPFYPPNIGGAETYTEALVNEARKKHDLVILTYQPLRGEAPSIQLGGHRTIMRIHWLFKPPAVWSGTGAKQFMLIVPKMLWCAIKLCREMKFDTVHAQGLCCAFIGIILKKIFKVKLLVTTLALYNFGHRSKKAKITKWILDHADVIFVEGNAGAKDIRDLNVGSAKGIRIQKFTHWVDLDRFKPRFAKHHGLRVLYVGRPIPEKGIHIVKEAEDILDCDRRKIVFKYIENLSYDELIKEYQQSDILVIPSQYSEGHSRVVIEGAACGCAIITSSCGALPEQVKDYGYILATNFPVIHLTDMLDWFQRDRKELKRAKNKARNYAENFYSPKNAEVMIDEY